MWAQRFGKGARGKRIRDGGRGHVRGSKIKSSPFGDDTKSSLVYSLFFLFFYILTLNYSIASFLVLLVCSTTKPGRSAAGRSRIVLKNVRKRHIF